MSVILDEHPDTPKKMQELARHKMILRLYADILTDMQICEVEGWDKMEYIRMLQELINSFTDKESKTK